MEMLKIKFSIPEHTKEYSNMLLGLLFTSIFIILVILKNTSKKNDKQFKYFFNGSIDNRLLSPPAIKKIFLSLKNCNAAIVDATFVALESL